MARIVADGLNSPHMPTSDDISPSLLLTLAFAAALLLGLALKFWLATRQVGTCSPPPRCSPCPVCRTHRAGRTPEGG